MKNRNFKKVNGKKYFLRLKEAWKMTKNTVEFFFEKNENR
jgi:hypothetical protein